MTENKKVILLAIAATIVIAWALLVIRRIENCSCRGNQTNAALCQKLIYLKEKKINQGEITYTNGEKDLVVSFADRTVSFELQETGAATLNLNRRVKTISTEKLDSSAMRANLYTSDDGTILFQENQGEIKISQDGEEIFVGVRLSQ